jgi:CHAT domain-containing protein
LLAPLPLSTRLGRTRVLRAQALLLLGQADAAQAEARAARADAETLGDRMLSYQACHVLGRLHEHSGDPESAAELFRQAILDVDGLRGGISRDDLRISFARDKVALYEDAARNALQRGDASEAFEHVERAKARALVDLLAAGPPIPLRAGDEDTRLAARVDELRDTLTSLYNRLHGDGEPRQRFAEDHQTLLAHMHAHEHELTAALARLRLCQSDYASLASVSVAPLEQIQSRLGPDDALLEYFLLDDAVLVFVVTDSAVSVFGPLATRTEIEDLIGQWHFHLAHFRHGPDFAIRHAGRLLATACSLLQTMHDRLIAPLRSVLDGRKLLIVPHGALHHVPFQALHDGKAFLIEHHDLSYAPSATTLVVQRLEPPRGDQTLIVGVPAPGLPYITAEVAAVAACRRHSTILLGSDATRMRFLAEAACSRTVHLATHAIFRADNPLYSAVRLGDGWLTAADIYGLSLAADLVVLSACETGTSAVLHGDELIGLTRGFLYAGAHSLVASLWPANDMATANLMSTFHTAIGDGVGVRCALGMAQREALARTPHPYYWAPFTVSGQPGE